MRRAIFTSTALKALHREHELAVVKQAQQHAACDLGIMADWQAHASLRSPIAASIAVWHCRIGNNATRAHGRCQQAFLNAANQQNLTFLVQVNAHFLSLSLQCCPCPISLVASPQPSTLGQAQHCCTRQWSFNCQNCTLDDIAFFRASVCTQATEAGNLVNGLPNFAKPHTALAPINSAFYSILTGTGEPAQLPMSL